MAKTARKSDAFQSGQQYLGMVYAKALLGVTEQSGKTEAVLQELDSLIADVLDKLPQLEATLASRRVPLEARVEMLDRAFRGTMSDELLLFLKVVSQHHRLDMLRAMQRAAHQLHDELRGRLAVAIKTATPVNQETLELVATKLRAAVGRQVDLHPEVDPEILGGLIVRIGDTVYDGSVANQLRQLREVALNNALQTMRGSADRFSQTA